MDSPAAEDHLVCLESVFLAALYGDHANCLGSFEQDLLDLSLGFDTQVFALACCRIEITGK